LKTLSRYNAGSLLLLFIFLSSCEEPEPYYNKEARPPEVKQLTITGLTEGQHVTGTLNIQFIPEIQPSEVDVVSLWVDEVLQYGYSTAPFEFSLNTKLWPEGEHTIMFGVYEKQPPDLGLLNLALVPSMMYTITVYFDHQPPTPVVLQSVVWNNDAGAPQLIWQKNLDPNFYAYYIIHERNGYYENGEFIYDRNITTYNDNAFDGAMGFTCSYQVAVYNRDQTVISNAITLTYPEIFPFASDPSTNAKRPIKSNDGTELYTLNFEGVKAYSLTSNTLLKSHDMLYKQPTGFALSKDGSKLYVIAGLSPVITVLDASTFEVLNTADPAGFSGYFTNDVVCGRPDRIYVSTDLTPGLKILDTNTLNIVGEYPARGIMDISSDNNTLFVANSDLNPAMVFSVDITTDSPVELHQQSASDVVRDIELSADGQTLFAIHDNDYPTDGNQFVDYWNASTLISYKKLYIPYQPFSMWLDEGTICIPYGNRNLNYFEPGGILQYSISSGSLLNEWKFVQAPYACLIGQGSLYAFGLKTWIVPFDGL